MQYARPTLSYVVPDEGLLSNEKNKYTYKTFPKLNSELYIKIDAPKMIYQSKFLISNDEVSIIFSLISGVMTSHLLITKTGRNIFTMSSTRFGISYSVLTYHFMTTRRLDSLFNTLFSF